MFENEAVISVEFTSCLVPPHLRPQFGVREQISLATMNKIVAADDRKAADEYAQASCKRGAHIVGIAFSRMLGSSGARN